MMTCMKCLRSMRCKKNGAVLHYGNGHCYAVDIYECPECGHRAADTSAKPYHLEPHQVEASRVSLGEWFIDMPQGD